MKSIRNKSSAVFFSLMTLCLAFLLLIPLGCGEKADKPAEEKPVETKAPVTAEEAAPPAGVTTGGEPATGNIPHISDIHFNPFYDSTLVAQLIKADAKDWEGILQQSQDKSYGPVSNNNETNYFLLVSALADMAKTANKPDFIIFTGDFIAHEFPEKFKANSQLGDSYDDFVKKTFTFMAMMFTKYLPGTPIYFSLGNNDSYSGDYNIKAGGDFLKDTTVILGDAWLKNANNKTKFQQTYPVGGYFIIDPPASDNTAIISLNSIFFSTRRNNDPANDPALKELNWFEETLKNVRLANQKAWLLLHIPPGANVYDAVKHQKYSAMWQDQYNTKFIQIMEAYAPEFTAGFCGHTHMDDFRILLDSETNTKALAFIRISPAISSQFGNNPGFQQMTYNRSKFSLIDYVLYYLNLEITDPAKAQWAKEYDFGATYIQQDISATTLLNVHKAIDNEPTIRQYYMTYYNVSDKVNPGLTDANWKAYWCGITYWTQTTFENCYQPPPQK
jgi:hypothetical protein